MKNVLSIQNLVFTLACLLVFASPCFADDRILLPRMPGDRLDVSMGNEVTHAALNAQEWLVRKQNADGSWGEGTNRLFETALVLFTLRAFGQPESAGACAKGDAYLKTLVVPCTSFPFGCDLSLSLPEIARAWPPASGTSGRRWLEIACSINRKGGGLASADNTVIDWRREVGQRLIDTQKVSLQGGGYWRAVPGVTGSDIAETAFSLLVFFEL